MRRHFRNTTGMVAVAAVLAVPSAGYAQDAAASILDHPALADLNPDCAAVIALLEETPGSDIANMPASAIEALEPGARECVLAVQDLLATSPDRASDDAEAPAATSDDPEAAAEPEVVTPEEQAEALTGTETADPATGAADEQAATGAPSSEEAPVAAAPTTEQSSGAAEAPGSAEHVETVEEPASQDDPETQATGEDAPAPDEQPEATDAAGAPGGDEAPETTEANEEIVETPETTEEETAAEAGAATRANELEVIQEDTELAAEAANEQVSAAAAGSDDTGAGETPEMQTEVVTEETSRSSSEEFAARESASSDGENDDGGLNLGQIAAGVLGGIVLNEILRPQEKVVENTGDRVVVERPNGEYYVLKDDNALLRQPGTELQTQTFSDGSTRQIAVREDGTRIETIRAANGRVLRRAKYTPDGREVLLFDDTTEFEPVEVSRLPEPEVERVDPATLEEDALREALAAEEAQRTGRRYSLSQIRNIRAVRNLVPIIELESVTFDSGSAAIRPSEAEELASIGRVLRDLIAENPDEVFLIEGHTDAVGGAAMNLALSDRRAESVALALTEYFDVPPENMVVQGYGESNLKVATPAAERQNRRAAVRRITPLLRTAAAGAN